MSYYNVAVIHKSERTVDSDHGFMRGWGISSSTTGAKGISMAYGVLPSGITAEPHYHLFETAIYILTGSVRVFLGGKEDEFVDVSAGDFLYIPAGVVHSPRNNAGVQMEYIVARNAPEEVAYTPQQ